MAGLTPAQGRQLLESGDHSDFLITCQGREIKVHKNLLASVSDFFEVLFKNDFKESREAKVDFPDEDPDTLYRFLEYIYTKDYSITFAAPTKSSTWKAKWSGKTVAKTPKCARPGSCFHEDCTTAGHRLHAFVYCCAHKYGVTRLQDLAYSRFLGTRNRYVLFWDASVLSLIYENTNQKGDRLRNHVTKRCIDYYKETLAQEEIAKVISEHEPETWGKAQNLQMQIQESETRKR